MATKPHRRVVKDFLTKDLVAIHAKDSLHDAFSLMTENRVTALPVIDHRGRCAGIISASDLVEFAADLDDELSDLGRVGEVSYQWLFDTLDRHDLERRTVDEVMTEDVTTITAQQTLIDAARLMLQNRVHRLPVVGKNEQLLGIISTMDVIAAFVDGVSE